jgi:hypothetical protein
MLSDLYGHNAGSTAQPDRPSRLRRVWYMLDANEPTGPHREITFREKVY